MKVLKTFEIIVWYRFIRAGQQEKDFEIHNIRAVDLQDAVDQAYEMYTPLKVIPFSYSNDNVKQIPSQINQK